MEPKPWYTVRNISINQDVIYTSNKNKVIEFLADKDLSKFRIDVLEYKPVAYSIDAKTFSAKFMKEH